MSPADTRNIRVLHHVNPLRAKMLYKTNVVCATQGRVLHALAPDLARQQWAEALPK